MNLDDDDDDMSGRLAIRRPKETSERRPDAMTFLPAVMLEHALGKSGMARLSGSRSFCLIVETRSDDWVSPVERYLADAGDWDQTVAKTTVDARRRDEVTGPAVLRTLAQGGRVAGVATRSGFLPDAMATAADIHVELPKVTAEIVETVIRRMTRRRVTVPPAVANLAFGDLVACLRSGDGPQAILRRFERAVASVKTITPVPYDVPHIRDLHGYGAAKDWALELIEDVEAWRRGEIEFGHRVAKCRPRVSAWPWKVDVCEEFGQEPEGALRGHLGWPMVRERSRQPRQRHQADRPGVRHRRCRGSGRAAPRRNRRRAQSGHPRLPVVRTGGSR